MNNGTKREWTVAESLVLDALKRNPHGLDVAAIARAASGSAVTPAVTPDVAATSRLLADLQA